MALTMAHVGWPVSPHRSARRIGVLKHNILLMSLVLLVLAGCVPTVIQSEYEVILVRYHNADEEDHATAVIVADDDPLRDAFQEHVWSDPMGRRLLLLVENTTAAFVATERPSSHPQTLANKPFLVLDSQRAGLLRDVQATHAGERFSVELAMGLGGEGQIDLKRAARRVPRAAGTMLLALVEVPVAADAIADAEVVIDEPTTPLLALHEGFVIAMETLYVQAQTGRLDTLDDDAELLSRYRRVTTNAFATDSERQRATEQAYATPGLVASFFFRLIHEANDYYPQRHLLWFANYEAEDTVYAKVLLAMHHMSGAQQASVKGFIQSYSEVFPAEREMIQRLADEVFGAE
jgi:hypothetical protein